VRHPAEETHLDGFAHDAALETERKKEIALS